MKHFIVPVIIGFLLVGCGKPGEPARETSAPSPTPAASSETATAPAAEPAGAFSITGRVLFKGAAPASKPLRMSADPVCEGLHSEPVLSQELVVNDDGTLRNVFVYVKSGLGNRQYAPPKDPVVLDQKGCLYQPHVQGVQVGQPILIRNSDNTLHNIHAMPENNPQFNVGQPTQGMETKRAFANPEIMVRFKCDVHPWMGCYMGVLNHPFFAVTGDGGEFAIPNLPAGEYVVEAWHEKLGTQTQSLTVAAGETGAIEFTFTNP